MKGWCSEELRKMREDKSTGVDNLSLRLLVGIGDAVVKPITIIFNKNTGYVYGAG